MDIHVYHHIVRGEAALDAVLARIEGALAMASAALVKLQAEVAEVRAVEESAMTLLAGLAQQIRDLRDDPAALDQLAADLDQSSQALAAAVAANTTP